jgi:nicotinamidase-related amidase
MSFPNFYDPKQVGRLFTPNTAQAVAEGNVAGLPHAARDKRRIILVLVDAQVDFIHADGSLCVPGAVEDTRRVIEWMFKNQAQLTSVAVSLDSHVPIQIFSPTWWVDDEGNHPDPFTPILSADVRSGKWKPLYEQGWSIEYVEKLETLHKKELMIWPYHTLIGTPGHTITPALYEAIAYHTAARQSPPVFLSKGSIPKTEHYSIMEPEVKVPSEPLGELNTSFLHMLATYDLVYIAGQAKSHCVLETVNSIMRYFSGQPHIIRKLRVLIDCTSSVAHPEIDFDTLANDALAKHERNGLTLVNSTDPLG